MVDVARGVAAEPCIPCPLPTDVEDPDSPPGQIPKLPSPGLGLGDDFAFVLDDPSTFRNHLPGIHAPPGNTGAATDEARSQMGPTI